MTPHTNQLHDHESRHHERPFRKSVRELSPRRPTKQEARQSLNEPNEPTLPLSLQGLCALFVTAPRILYPICSSWLATQTMKQPRAVLLSITTIFCAAYR